MKHTTHTLLAAVGAATLALAAVSCGDDDEKYRSESPKIARITVSPLDGHTSIRAGERFVATAVQSKTGVRLYKASYVWTATSSGTGTASSKQNKSEVVYDNDNGDATDTLVVTEAGKYTLTFSADYRPSGSTDNWISKNGSSFSESLDGGGTASYSAGVTLFKIKAVCTVNVLPAQ